MSPLIWIVNKNDTKSIIESEIGIVEMANENCRKKSKLSGPRILLNSIKKKLKIVSPKIDNINNIDKYSRLSFPILFIIFNLFYWIFYYLQINANF